MPCILFWLQWGAFWDSVCASRVFGQVLYFFSKTEKRSISLWVHVYLSTEHAWVSPGPARWTCSHLHRLVNCACPPYLWLHRKAQFLGPCGILTYAFLQQDQCWHFLTSAFLLSFRNHLLNLIKRFPSHQARLAAHWLCLQNTQEEAWILELQTGSFRPRLWAAKRILFLSAWRTRWMETWSIIQPPHWRLCRRNWLRWTAEQVGAPSSHCLHPQKCLQKKLQVFQVRKKKGTFRRLALLPHHPPALCSHPSIFWLNRLWH